MQITAPLDAPPDDDAITQAMADLNVKLSAWSAALSQLAAKRSKPSAASSHATAAAASKGSKSKPTSSHPTKRGAEKSAARAPDSRTAKAKLAAAGARASEPPPAQESAPTADVTAEDEKILAEMDPETANAIRIRRRLYGPGVPIDEVIKRYDEERSAESASGSKRSSRFWKWGSS